MKPWIGYRNEQILPIAQTHVFKRHTILWEARHLVKVLWLCNVMPNQIKKNENMPEGHFGGWISGLLSLMVSSNDVELTVCAPVVRSASFKQRIYDILFGVEPAKYAEALGFSYYLFTVKDYHVLKCVLCPKMIETFKSIIMETKPDVVHIFGTEYPHSLAMVEACREMSIGCRVMVHIQGLVSVYASHFTEGLSDYLCKWPAIIEKIKRDSMLKEQKELRFRGRRFELKVLEMVNHVIGRTEWDYVCTKQVNPNAQYHKCNEALREGFYNHAKWNIRNCIPYSIFISQGDYPVKGLHYAIEALSLLIKEFPGVHLYIAGPKLLGESKSRLSSYAKYFKRFVTRNRLDTHITFLGLLSESQMCERFVSSHIFVLPSTIENSPNSLGEAGILGVPRVAAYVGGVPDMVRHGIDGFLYQHSAPYMLAGFIKRLFENDKLAVSFSKEAVMAASRIHDRSKIIETILGTYKAIVDNEGSQ